MAVRADRAKAGPRDYVAASLRCSERIQMVNVDESEPDLTIDFGEVESAYRAGGPKDKDALLSCCGIALNRLTWTVILEPSIISRDESSDGNR